MRSQFQKISILLVVLSLLPEVLLAEKRYNYSIDLIEPVKDRVFIQLDCAGFGTSQVTYHFPKTVPGTYKEADYGRFAKKFKAFDSNGDPLPVKKEGKNSFIISNADDLSRLEYWLAPTWDKKHSLKVWPMAGTGFRKDEYFAFNSGAFGYFEGEELNPVQLTFSSPEHLYPMTVLDKLPQDGGGYIIPANNYHHLVDCPIMFAEPDTTSFNVHGAYVGVGVKREAKGEAWAGYLHESLEPAMEAIGGFLDSLPVDRYTYIMYFKNGHRLGEILEEKRFMGLKVIGWVIKNGIPAGGALEHQTSSFYWLPDMGPKYQEDLHELLAEIAIHEFMHIIAPLNLHSEYINDFNYADPIMSKHLWLYEGITEYYADLIQVHGGLMTPKRYLTRTLRSKIKTGENFPNEKMSFTEMSENVFQKKYKRHYLQVYQRGAAIGAMLDIEIIRLTGGKRTLIDVMMELVDRYGPDRAFPEATFIDEFCELVHPDLRDFFSFYVEGQEDIPYEKILAQVGVEYVAEEKIHSPRHPILDNKLKRNNMSMGEQVSIKKVSRKDWLGFQEGDKYDRGIYYNHYMDDGGHYIPEGQVVDIEIVRDGETMFLQDTVKYVEKEHSHRLRLMPDPTPEQVYLFNVWLGFQEPGADFQFPGLPDKMPAEKVEGEELP